MDTDPEIDFKSYIGDVGMKLTVEHSGIECIFNIYISELILREQI